MLTLADDENDDASANVGHIHNEGERTSGLIYDSCESVEHKKNGVKPSHFHLAAQNKQQNSILTSVTLIHHVSREHLMIMMIIIRMMLKDIPRSYTNTAVSFCKNHM